jgi:hypothetical protein
MQGEFEWKFIDYRFQFSFYCQPLPKSTTIQNQYNYILDGLMQRHSTKDIVTSSFYCIMGMCNLS